MPLHNRIANISERTKTTAIKSILSRTQRERERGREGGISHLIDQPKAHARRKLSRALPILARRGTSLDRSIFISDRGTSICEISSRGKSPRPLKRRRTFIYHQTTFLIC